jgi:hypothetical protein
MLFHRRFKANDYDGENQYGTSDPTETISAIKENKTAIVLRKTFFPPPIR